MAFTESSSPHDAEQITEEAAALAAHLQRHGVQWLPKPNSDAVEHLADCFAEAPHEPETTSRGDAGPESPAPSAATIQSAVNTSPADQPSAPARPRASAAPARLAPGGSSAGLEGPYPGESLAEADRATQLQTLQSEVEACKRCEILSQCRTQTVFGEGDVQPRVVFFGEGPGADEDRTGRPFVGKAGQLLTKMIEACKLRRESVYILNTVKCRPPGNRNPEAEELENCRDFYERQLNVLRPEYIICLGAVSAQELLKSKLSVGRLRGKFHSHFASKVLVTYHPAYLLRNPAAKKAAWEDLQIMMRDAGLR